MIASSKGHSAVVQALLEYKADVLAVATKTHYSALHLAARRGHVEVIAQLVAAGARVEAYGRDGWQPIHCAAAEGHLSAVKELIARGAPAMAPTQHSLATPLDLACGNKFSKLIRWFITHGCDVNRTDATGQTALHRAAAQGDLNLVKILIEEGNANVSVADNAGYTALDAADKHNMCDVAVYLYEKGSESMTTKRATTVASLGPLKWYRPRILNCPEARFSPSLASVMSRVYLFGGIGLPRGVANHDPENRLEERHLATSSSKSAPFFHVVHNDLHMLDFDCIAYNCMIPSVIQNRHRHARLSFSQKGPNIRVGADGLSGESVYDTDEHSDQDWTPSVVKADTPFRREDQFGYFELQIISLGSKRILTIGLTDDAFPLERKEPGWIADSYGLHFDDSMAFHNYGWGKPIAVRFQEGDVVGCGINYVAGEVFFTKNGKFLGVAFRDPQSNSYWPTIGTENPNAKFRVNFGAQPFHFGFVVRTQLHSSLKITKSEANRRFPNPATVKWRELAQLDDHRPPVMPYSKLFALKCFNSLLLVPDSRFLAEMVVWTFDLEAENWRLQRCQGEVPQITPRSQLLMLRDRYVFLYTPVKSSTDTPSNPTDPTQHNNAQGIAQSAPLGGSDGPKYPHLSVLDCFTWTWTELLPRVLLGAPIGHFVSLFSKIAHFDQKPVEEAKSVEKSMSSPALASAAAAASAAALAPPPVYRYNNPNRHNNDTSDESTSNEQDNSPYPSSPPTSPSSTSSSTSSSSSSSPYSSDSDDYPPPRRRSQDRSGAKASAAADEPWTAVPPVRTKSSRLTASGSPPLDVDSLTSKLSTLQIATSTTTQETSASSTAQAQASSVATQQNSPPSESPSFPSYLQSQQRSPPDSARSGESELSSEASLASSGAVPRSLTKSWDTDASGEVYEAVLLGYNDHYGGKNTASPFSKTELATMETMHVNLLHAACDLATDSWTVRLPIPAKQPLEEAPEDALLVEANDSQLLFLTQTETLSIDLQSLKHETRSISGARPSIHLYSATTVGSDLVTFGGWDKVKQQNEVYVLDAKSATWYKPHITGSQVPRPRNSHAAVLVELTHEAFATDREDLWWAAPSPPPSPNSSSARLLMNSSGGIPRPPSTPDAAVARPTTPVPLPSISITSPPDTVPLAQPLSPTFAPSGSYNFGVPATAAPKPTGAAGPPPLSTSPTSIGLPFVPPKPSTSPPGVSNGYTPFGLAHLFPPVSTSTPPPLPPLRLSQSLPNSRKFILHGFGWNGRNAMDDIDILALDGRYEADELETFLTQRRAVDLTFRFPSDPAAPTILAHRLPLISRSSYFRQLLATNAPAQANAPEDQPSRPSSPLAPNSSREMQIIDIPDVSYLVFLCLLKYLYSDVVDTTLLSDSVTYRRFVAASEKYAPQHKRKLIQEFVLTYISEPSSLSYAFLVDLSNTSTSASNWKYTCIPCIREDMRYAFLNPLLSDVSFKVEGQSIPAHKVVICSRSTYFRALCMGGLRESREKVIHMTDTTYKPFLAVLEYLYTRKIDYEALVENIVEVFLLACQYDIKRLKAELENVMAFNLNAENACSLLLLSDQHSASKLKASCRQWIATHLNQVRQTDDFIARRELIEPLLIASY